LVKYDLLSVRGETRLEADFQGGYSAGETQIFRLFLSSTSNGKPNQRDIRIG